MVGPSNIGGPTLEGIVRRRCLKPVENFENEPDQERQRRPKHEDRERDRHRQQQQENGVAEKGAKPVHEESHTPGRADRGSFEMSAVCVTHPAGRSTDRRYVRHWFTDDTDLELSSTGIIAELHRAVAARIRARLPVASCR